MTTPTPDPGRVTELPHGPDPRRPTPHSVSASFQHPEAVQAALERLVRAGIPRDMIDVVVSPAAAEKFYPGRARERGRDALRLAGAGGLVGLGIGSLISLALIMMPGFYDEGLVPYVQLIGPNFATVAGAMIGAVIGLFRRRRPDPRHARAAEEPDAIIMIVALRSREDAERTAAILARAGGADPRIQL